MTLSECQARAIEHLNKTGKQMRFKWVGNSTKECQWLDPENGVFVILGVPGFIDARRVDKGLLKGKFTHCEV